MPDSVRLLQQLKEKEKVNTYSSIKIKTIIFWLKKSFNIIIFKKYYSQ